MYLKGLVNKLKRDGYNIELQDNGYVYQINNVANLDAITLSESPFDYRISFWQGKDNVQTAVDDVNVLYRFIKSITF